MHSLRAAPNVIDVRNIGLVGAVELASRDGKVGARGADVMVECFANENLLIRVTGDIIAMSPPLIVERDQIDQIVERLGRALRRVS